MVRFETRLSSVMDKRRAQIVGYLRDKGKTSVNELASVFETSGATIRADLRSLEDDGLVLRRYGSAEATSQNKIYGTEDRSMDEKQEINLDVKCRIAEAAAAMVEDGSSIILDTGSTTLQMVPHLKRVRALTLMTNSMHIVQAVANSGAEHTILMPGGTYRRKSASFHGSWAERTFREFSFDKLFIGADGFDLAQGTTTYNDSYQVSQVMSKAVDQVIVVMDSSKFGRRSPNLVVPLEKIDIVVTDSGISPEALQSLEGNGIQVVIV